MKFKSYLLLSSALLGLVNVSCSDKDDSNEYSDTDSRIRSVHVNGLNVPFVVNDVEKVIFNYDSLTYGTDVSHMMIYFSDYDVDTPGLTYLVQEVGGNWKYYSNKTADSVYLDLNNLKVRTISLDKANMSDYRLDIRIHKYDINSFNWQKLSDLSFSGEVVSYKVVEVNNTYCCFYTNKEGDSYVLSSTDAKKWTSKKLDKQNYDWSSLTVFGEKTVAFAGEKIATIDPTNDYAVALVDNNAGLKSLLFSLGDKYWAVGADGIYSCSDDGLTFEKALDTPSGFPTENITTLVALTGSRTRIAYIYGVSNGQASVWALDKGGNLIKATTSNSGLPVLSKAAMVSIDNEVCLLGGISDNKYMNTCYSSSDAGITWSENWHKELPSEIGRVANLGAFVTADSKLIFVAGETADGVATGVWNGSLKGSK